jgi:CO/xanthine dehydrogenase Mo-binding subunit
VIPVAAAVRNAIKDAIGEQFTELPITPERVRASLQRAAARRPR